ncbi:Uncharacterised protein [Salmonella enterica subsp. enterica serovar Typhi]|nr:Uncharacterised protein [Salmonella enterica subsp. enterica serovar Typhi]
MNQLQTLLKPAANVRIGVAARQAVVEQRGDHRITLQHPHAATDGRQHKRIAPQSGRGINHIRQVIAFDTDGFRHRFAAPAAELAPVRHRAADKIDKNAAELRFVALAQLQMLRRQYQRHRVVFVMLQSPAGSQNR